MQTSNKVWGDRRRIRTIWSPPKHVMMSFQEGEGVNTTSRSNETHIENSWLDLALYRLVTLRWWTYSVGNLIEVSWRENRKLNWRWGLWGHSIEEFGNTGKQKHGAAAELQRNVCLRESYFVRGGTSQHVCRLMQLPNREEQGDGRREPEYIAKIIFFSRES